MIGKKIYLGFCLVLFYLLALGTISAQPKQNVDSANIYFRKAMGIRESHTLPNNTDSVTFKIKYLKQAILFHDVDSFWFFLSETYFYTHILTEFEKTVPRIFKAKIRTHIYDEEALNLYGDEIWWRQGFKQKLRIYQKIRGDSIIFMGQKVHYDTTSGNTPNDIKESIIFMNTMINQIKDKMKSAKDTVPCYYADIAEKYGFLGEFRKARSYLRLGLKKFPQSGCLYYQLGSLNHNRWRLVKAEYYYKKASELGHSLGAEWAAEINFLIQIRRR